MFVVDGVVELVLFDGFDFDVIDCGVYVKVDVDVLFDVLFG